MLTLALCQFQSTVLVSQIYKLGFCVCELHTIEFCLLKLFVNWLKTQASTVHHALGHICETVLISPNIGMHEILYNTAQKHVLYLFTEKKVFVFNLQRMSLPSHLTAPAESAVAEEGVCEWISGG